MNHGVEDGSYKDNGHQPLHRDKLEQADNVSSHNLSTLLSHGLDLGYIKMMERGSISTVSQTTSLPVANQISCSIDAPQFHGNMDEKGTGTSKVFLAYKNASQHLSSSGIKAGLGILKVATSQWKQEKKTRSGPPVRQLSTANSSHPCKRSPLDQLAALVLHGKSRQRKIGQEQAPTKPQNCKRIVVLGAPRVGKTSIVRRYLREGFMEEYNPTSEDFLRKMFRIRGESYQIDVLDASRERDFPAKRRLSILTGACYSLCPDTSLDLFSVYIFSKTITGESLQFFCACVIQPHHRPICMTLMHTVYTLAFYFCKYVIQLYFEDYNHIQYCYLFYYIFFNIC